MNAFQPDGKYNDTSRFSTLKTFPTDELPPQSVLQRIAANYGQQISHSIFYAATSLQQVDIQSFLQLLVKANAQINIIILRSTSSLRVSGNRYRAHHENRRPVDFSSSSTKSTSRLSMQFQRIIRTLLNACKTLNKSTTAYDQASHGAWAPSAMGHR